MQMNDGVRAGLHYIEQNLKTTIAAAELADIAGYSVWHFGRLFAQETGMTVAYYILKRRLDSALSEIAEGRKAASIVLEYGFDTYAGFYKAFVRLYGCSPKKYLSLLNESGGNAMNLRDIMKHWEIDQDLPINDVYIMDGTKVADNVWMLGDEFVLKTGERSGLLKDLRLRQALAGQGFSAGAPVLTKRGEVYLDGEDVYVLMRKVPGAPLDKADRFGEKRREFGYKCGASIAKLHRALADVEADIMPEEANLFEQVMGWALPEVKKQRIAGLTDAFFDDYEARFGALYEKLPKQLVHRDPNPSNILFSGGEVAGFIDFDLSERNVRLWDVCYCATGILCEWRGVQGIDEKWLDILPGIVSGYGSINPLTAEEKEAVFYVICAIEMICVAYFCAQEGGGFEELAKTNREMLSFIAKNKARIMQK